MGAPGNFSNALFSRDTPFLKLPKAVMAFNESATFKTEGKR